jgi:hypothetical protein
MLPNRHAKIFPVPKCKRADQVMLWTVGINPNQKPNTKNHNTQFYQGLLNGYQNKKRNRIADSLARWKGLS